MRFSFYVSGRASRLRKLLEHGDQIVLPSTQVVFSDDARNADLKGELIKRGIDFVCLDHAVIPPAGRSEQVSAALLKVLREYDVDYCYCFGDRMLQGEILAVYENRIINFHPSLLPAFPGRHAIDQALRAGAFLLGNTAHIIDSGIDTGSVIMQSVMPASVFDERGYDGVLDVQLDMLRTIHGWIENGQLKISNGRVRVTGTIPAPVYMVPKSSP